MGGENINLRATDTDEELRKALNELTSLVGALSTSNNELSQRQSETDQAIAKLSTSIELHFKKERDHEQTLRSIDESVQQLAVKIPEIALDIHREHSNSMKSVFDRVDSVEKDLSAFKVNTEAGYARIISEANQNVEQELEKLSGVAKNHVIVIWALISAIAILALMAFNDLKTTVKENSGDIKVNTEYRIKSG